MLTCLANMWAKMARRMTVNQSICLRTSVNGPPLFCRKFTTDGARKLLLQDIAARRRVDRQHHTAVILIKADA